MRSIIICEGSTDCVLLQYFLRVVYGWKDDKKNNREPIPEFRHKRVLEKEDKKLIIGAAGGYTQLMNKLKFVLDSNSIAADSEVYHDIVVVTDRDEVGTEESFLNQIEKIFGDKELTIRADIEHNQWMECEYTNGQKHKCIVKILLLVIPFAGTGAMETFLLNSISNQDEYDKEIIKKGNNFVEQVDPERRYLNKRKYLTKAKFDVYFSVRTAAEQFVERQNILKGVPWEEYLIEQKEFEKLGQL